MRPILPKLGRTSCLVSILPKLDDTSLAQANLGDFLERARNPKVGLMMEKIVRSGLIKAAAFPIVAPCPNLVIACMNKYDVDNRCIRTSSGELLVEISRETVMAAMGTPHKESYENWSIGTSYVFFFEKKSTYRSVIAINWLLKVQKGGSQLPKPLTREHFIAEVRDIVILLNRLKGNSHSFYWKDWMYFFIQVLLAGEKFLDWVQVIAERLHEGLSNFVGMSSFYMSSYLFYILAYTRDWQGLNNQPWVDGMKVYDYYPLLQQQKYAKHFTRWNDVFAGRLAFELQGDVNKRMPAEAMELISIYGSFFIQFPRFTYL